MYPCLVTPSSGDCIPIFRNRTVEVDGENFSAIGCYSCERFNVSVVVASSILYSNLRIDLEIRAFIYRLPNFYFH